MNGRLLWLPSCGSTNDEARAVWDDPGIAAVATEVQTAGRGRRGHTWFSPPGCGLYFTWIVRTPLPPAHAGVLPLLAGVVTAQFCERRGVHPSLKWPNDLLLSGRKLAGILCESRVQGPHLQALVGIGLNLRRPAEGYPPGVPGIALETPLAAPRVAAELLDALEQGLSGLFTRPGDDPFAALLPAWRARALPVGTPMRVGEHVGTYADLAADGALLLDTAAGRVRIDAGEVELVSGGSPDRSALDAPGSRS